MPVTTTPDATSAAVWTWSAPAWDDPYAFASHDNKIITGYELAKHEEVTLFLRNRLSGSLLGGTNAGLGLGLGYGLPNIATSSAAPQPYTLYTPEVNLLTTGDYNATIAIPSGKMFFTHACSLIVTKLTGVVNTQPTIRFGTNTSTAKYLAATLAIALNALGTRERFQTLLVDVGETGFMSAGITVAGTLTSGSLYRGKFIFEGYLV